MQRCPKCNRTYQDDSQKFCTFDGGRLMVDTEAPTTFDLGPAPQTDPLGATVMGPAPDLNKTVAGTPPPLTSEIPPPAQTGPTPPSAAPPWQGAPQPTAPQQPPPPQAPTGPTTTSPLGAPPAGASQSSAPLASSGGLSQAPTAPVSQSGPVATGPQPPSGALGAGPAVAAAAPPKKSSRVLMLVGGLAVLLLLVIAGGVGFYFLAMRPKAETATANSSSPTLERETSATNTNSNSSANANSSNTNTSAATTSQPPVTPPPNATKFVNSRDKVTGSLAEHFVDFSLYYPNGWAVDTKAGTSGSSNFFKANRMLSDDTGDYLLESLAVGWYQSNGTMQFDRPIFPNRVEFFNNLFAKDYPNYQKVSEGETKFNGLDAYQFTFKSLVKGTGKGDIDLWGRVIFLPVGSEDAKNGVVLLMLASSAAPEIKSLDDVGEKGELPTILKTFRFGS
ncbi:MAG: hypothetical protein ICV60_06695 [Pyrinomonadaceae bacterium]|nr:hypothetical protein [Pyrinomonadaceae bacterium]